MTLPVDEFIRRFLMHVLHRIRHYGLFPGESRMLWRRWRNSSVFL
jgi:hypothetical protein